MIRLMTALAQIFKEFQRKVLIQLELHRSLTGNRLSSRASSAA